MSQLLPTPVELPERGARMVELAPLGTPTDLAAASHRSRLAPAAAR